MHQVNDTLSRLQSRSALKNKDSLSRLSEAIDMFKREKSIQRLNPSTVETENLPKVTQGVNVKQLAKDASEI